MNKNIRKKIGKFLCKIGLHKWRTNEVGITDRCDREDCYAVKWYLF